MDWSQMEEIDLEFNKNPKRVRFEDSEEKTISCEFENKLNEMLKIQERINILINELHILYTFKQ